jgi:PAS domain S-box-containing protein
MNRFGATGKIGPYEKQYIRKDGTRWWGLFTGTKLGENFGVEYVLDVSDTKEAEALLRESEERFRQFAENSADVFWILNAKTQQLEYINPIYEKMFGRPAACNARPQTGLDLVPEDRQKSQLTAAHLLVKLCAITASFGRATGQRWIRDTGFRSATQRATSSASPAGTDVTDEKERRALYGKRREIAAPHRRRAGIRDVPDGSGQSHYLLEQGRGASVRLDCRRSPGANRRNNLHA